MIELDDIDKRILGVLQADGRLPMVELADRVGLSPTPCQPRPWSHRPHWASLCRRWCR